MDYYYHVSIMLLWVFNLPACSLDLSSTENIRQHIKHFEKRKP